MSPAERARFSVPAPESEPIPETLRSGGDVVSGTRARIARQMPSEPPSEPPASVSAWEMLSPLSDDEEDDEPKTLRSGRLPSKKHLPDHLSPSMLDQRLPSEEKERIASIQRAAVVIDVALTAIARKSVADDWGKLAIENAKYIVASASDDMAPTMQRIRSIAQTVIASVRQIETSIERIRRLRMSAMTAHLQRQALGEREAYQAAQRNLEEMQKQLTAWLDEEEAEEMRQKIEQHAERSSLIPAEDSASFDLGESDWVDDASQYPTNPVL